MSKLSQNPSRNHGQKRKILEGSSLNPNKIAKKQEAKKMYLARLKQKFRELASSKVLTPEAQHLLLELSKKITSLNSKHGNLNPVPSHKKVAIRILPTSRNHGFAVSEGIAKSFLHRQHILKTYCTKFSSKITSSF